MVCAEGERVWEVEVALQYMYRTKSILLDWYFTSLDRVCYVPRGWGWGREIERFLHARTQSKVNILF